MTVTKGRADRYAVLLRGINLGRRQLAMADFKALLEDLGYREVKTHLRSGQAVLTDPAGGSAKTAATRAAATRIADRVESAIAKEHGLDVPVVVRTRAELAKVIAANPFVRPGQPERDPAKVFCVFLSAQLTAADLTTVDPAAYEPEEFALGPGGREIFLSLPGGMGVSTLGAVKWDRVTGNRQLVATARNWRTTLKLLELLDG